MQLTREQIVWAAQWVVRESLAHLSSDGAAQGITPAEIELRRSVRDRRAAVLRKVYNFAHAQANQPLLQSGSDLIREKDLNLYLLRARLVPILNDELKDETASAGPLARRLAVFEELGIELDAVQVTKLEQFDCKEELARRVTGAGDACAKRLLQVLFDVSPKKQERVQSLLRKILPNLDPEVASPVALAYSVSRMAREEPTSRNLIRFCLVDLLALPEAAVEAAAVYVGEQPPDSGQFVPGGLGLTSVQDLVTELANEIGDRPDGQLQQLFDALRDARGLTPAAEPLLKVLDYVFQGLPLERLLSSINAGGGPADDP